jgi:hypothetical protein
MSVWASALAEASSGRTALLLAGLVVLALAARLLGHAPARVLKAPLFLFAAHLAAGLAAAVLRAAGSDLQGGAHLLALMLAAVCAIRLAQELLFTLLLPRAGLRGSRILSDVVTAGASIVAVFALASRAGFNVSGLIATSAVLTAVIGLALRDTLGNVIGGLSLQTDRSIRPGDWIRVGEVEGRVVDIRWRYTAVETRNGETLIVPNGVLTNEKVMVLGRRQGAPLQQRRWVHFNVDAPVAARGRAGGHGSAGERDDSWRRRAARAGLPVPRGPAELRALRGALLADRLRARRPHRQRGADARVLRAAAGRHRPGGARARCDDRASASGWPSWRGPITNGGGTRWSRSRSCGRWTRRTVTSWPTGCCTRPSRAASC